MESYVILKDYVKTIKRFNTWARTVEFQVKPVPENVDPVSWVKDAITQIVLRGTENLDPENLVGFTFCSTNFERGQGWLRFQEASKVTVDDVWRVLNGIFQSNSTGLNTDTFCLGITSVRLPVGRGKGRKYNTFEEECSRRRGIVAINNKDNLCLPRALVVAIANATKDPEYKQVRDRQGVQKEKANELITNAGVSISEVGAGIPEVQKFRELFWNRI